MTDPLAALQERYARLCDRLAPHTPRDSYQTRILTTPHGEGAPHVEQVAGALHYVVTERGRELQRRVAASEDELLYWLLLDVVRGIAMHVEAPRRRRGEDGRRRYFAREVELLSRLHSEWAARRKEEQAQILSRYPFRDAS